MSSLDPDIEVAIRWINKASWHLTVVFLGSIDTCGLDDVKGAAAEAAAECQSFTLEFEGAGAFPGIRNPRVLWVGVGSGKDKWCEFASRTRSAVGKLVPLRREKEHIPHLTVARIRRSVDVGRVVETLSRIENAAMQVSKLSVVESVLSSEGAKYKTLEEYQLAG